MPERCQRDADMVVAVTVTVTTKASANYQALLYSTYILQSKFKKGAKHPVMPFDGRGSFRAGRSDTAVSVPQLDRLEAKRAVLREAGMRRL